MRSRPVTVRSRNEAAQMSPSPIVYDQRRLHRWIRVLWICRNRFWKTASARERSVTGGPWRTRLCHTARGTPLRLATYSFQAPTTSLLSPSDLQVRARRHRLSFVHHELPVGRLRHLEPIQSPGRRPSDDAPEGVEAGAMAGAVETGGNGSHDTPQVGANRRDREDPFLPPGYENVAPGHVAVFQLRDQARRADLYPQGRVGDDRRLGGGEHPHERRRQRGAERSPCRQGEKVPAAECLAPIVYGHRHSSRNVQRSMVI